MRHAKAAGALAGCGLVQCVAVALTVSVAPPWPAFGLHPLLMTLGCGLLAPLGAAAWRVGDGARPRAQVKRVHAALLGAAALANALGVADVWFAHERDGAPHVQTAHSRVGACALALFAAALLIGALAFGTRLCGEAAKRALVPVHAGCARAAVALGVVAIPSGVVSYAGRDADANARLQPAVFAAVGTTLALASLAEPAARALLV